jgi:hypothetical protein
MGSREAFSPNWHASDGALARDKRADAKQCFICFADQPRHIFIRFEPCKHEVCSACMQDLRKEAIRKVRAHQSQTRSQAGSTGEQKLSVYFETKSDKLTILCSALCVTALILQLLLVQLHTVQLSTNGCLQAGKGVKCPYCRTFVDRYEAVDQRCVRRSQPQPQFDA